MFHALRGHAGLVLAHTIEHSCIEMLGKKSKPWYHFGRLARLLIGASFAWLVFSFWLLWRPLPHVQILPASPRIEYLRSEAEEPLQPLIQPPHVLQLCLFSDRFPAAYSTIRSICAHTNASLRFLLVVPEGGELIKKSQMLVDACPTATFLVNTMEELTTRIVSLGHVPVWDMKFRDGEQDPEAYPWAVRLAKWDYSLKHISAFNHIRFYMPYIEPFKSLHRVIFLDDDLIIQGDIKKVWEYEIIEGKAILATCLNWLWSNCKMEWNLFFDASYLMTPYLGWGQIDKHRSLEDAICKTDAQTQCMHPKLFEFLSNFSRAAFGETGEVSLQTLNKTIAWNFGLDLFDLKRWRKFELTERYLRWMEFNLEHAIFAPTSLAFGLGISYFAMVGSIECRDDLFPVIQGLGFLPPHVLARYGYEMDSLPNLFGLHFNGDEKPWEPNNLPEYSHLYLPFATPDVQQVFEAQKTKPEFKEQDASSFILLAEHRSGSDWLVQLLSQHPQICLTPGWPKETFAPYYVAAAGLQQECGFAGDRCVWAKLNYQAVAALQGGWCMKNPTVEAQARALEMLGHDYSNLCSVLNDVLSNNEIVAASTETRADSIGYSMTKIWSAYYRHVMQSQLIDSKTPLKAKSPMGDLMHCKCPATAKVMGMKVMFDWVGPKDDLLKENPIWGLNFDARVPGRSPGQFFYSVLGEAHAIGTKVILLKRRDPLRSYLSSIRQDKSLGCESSVGNADRVRLPCDGGGNGFIVDVQALIRKLSWTVFLRRRVMQIVQQYKVEVLDIEYETCATAPHACLRSIDDFLGLQFVNSSSVANRKVNFASSRLVDLIINHEEVRAALALRNMSDFWID